MRGNRSANDVTGTWVILLHVIPLLLLWSAVSAEAATATPAQSFVWRALQGEIDSEALWLINPDGQDGIRDELLFAVDNHLTANKLCRDTRQLDHITNVVSITAYYRPGVVERFCLWEDGHINSFLSRKQLSFTTVGPAPSLKDLAAQIDALGPEQTCVPPSHRGILFETMELLCFAMGHKPAVIRQRQIRHDGSGHSSLGLLSGVPANLFVPHTRLLITWLLRQEFEQVWRGISQVQWDTEPFEHSIVLARDAALGQKLVDLHVQDASVPHQESIVATANYIAHVGAAIGYSQKEVRFYLETAGVISNADGSTPEEEWNAMIDTALREAFETDVPCDDGESDQQSCPQKQQYDELSSFRAFLNSEEASGVSPRLMRQVVEPLDDVFFLI